MISNGYISNTLKNSYNKIDQERFVRRPSFEEVPFTSFFSAEDLIFFDHYPDREPEDIQEFDKQVIIDMIISEEI